MGSENRKSLGAVGFEAYGNHPGPHGLWKTGDGCTIPQWANLRQGLNDPPDDTPNPGGPLTCERWDVAAAAIIAEQERRTGSQVAAVLCSQLEQHSIPHELDYAQTQARLIEELLTLRSFRERSEAGADIRLADQLCTPLSNFCGEHGDSEGAVETLTRLLEELRNLRTFVKGLPGGTAQVVTGKSYTDAMEQADLQASPRTPHGFSTADRRISQLYLDAPYQQVNCSKLSPGSIVTYTMGEDVRNPSTSFAVVAAVVVKMWPGNRPVLRIFGEEPIADFTRYVSCFTIATPGTPEASGAWSWGFSGLPQCPCGAGCRYSTGKCSNPKCSFVPEAVNGGSSSAVHPGGLESEALKNECTTCLKGLPIGRPCPEHPTMSVVPRGSTRIDLVTLEKWDVKGYPVPPRWNTSSLGGGTEKDWTSMEPKHQRFHWWMLMSGGCMSDMSTEEDLRAFILNGGTHKPSVAVDPLPTAWKGPYPRPLGHDISEWRKSNEEQRRLHWVNLWVAGALIAMRESVGEVDLRIFIAQQMVEVKSDRHFGTYISLTDCDRQISDFPGLAVERNDWSTVTCPECRPR